MKIIITPYDKTAYVPSTGGVSPIGGYHYKSPAGTLWNVDSITGDVVKLWTVNAWGATHWEHVNVHQFRATWQQYGEAQ